MKFASFDIELEKPLADKELNSKNFTLTGISCAAIALSDQKEIIIIEGNPEVNQDQAQKIVRTLLKLDQQGYKLVTWNGCGFDFPVLANASGNLTDCASLALNHLDLMLYVTFKKGWYLSLEKALDGANLEGKIKEIKLNDGTKLKNMDGSKAPMLWQKGEKKAVIQYLKQDVSQQLELAIWISENKKICWKSNSGKPWTLLIDKLHTVQECFQFPEPDVSWMDNPPKRTDFTEWMPSSLQP